MERTLLILVSELNSLNDDNLAERVIRNNDVQWCLGELQDILDVIGDMPVDRLRELKQADDEGRCVVLPCDPGQVVWAANSFGVSSHQIRMLVRDKDGDFACSMIKFPLEDFGRKVFLTREEAEAALRREQDG